MADLRLDRSRRQRHGAREVGLGAFPVPVVGHLQPAEHGIGLALAAVDRQRPPRGVGRELHGLVDRQRRGGSWSTTAGR